MRSSAKILGIELIICVVLRSTAALGFGTEVTQVTPLPLKCPLGWYVYDDKTACVNQNGIRYLAYKGQWWKEIDLSPAGLVIQNPGTREIKQAIAKASLQSFVGMACRWSVAPFPIFAHRQRFNTTNYQAYECNNGTFLFLGNVTPPATYSPQNSRGQVIRDRVEEYHWDEEHWDWSQHPDSGAFYKS